MSDIETRKDNAIKNVSDAYAKGMLTETELTSHIDSIHSCETTRELDTILTNLPQTISPARVSEPLEITCTAGNVKKYGDWCKSNTCMLTLKLANAVLDYTEYADETGLELFLDIEASTSSVKIIVPRGFEVIDSFGKISMSDVKNRPKRGETYARLRITGELSLSSVKIKYR